MSDFAKSSPMSDPMERMAHAQSRGLLGQEQMQQRDQMYGMLNQNTDAGNMADLLQNLTTNQIGQRMSLDSSHMFEALNARRQAMGQVTGMGAQSLPAAGFQQQQSGPDFGSIFGNLANIFAQSKARRPLTQGNNSVGVTGTTNLQLPPSMTGVGVPMASPPTIGYQKPGLMGQIASGFNTNLGYP
jgi:hypothetical protein